MNESSSYYPIKKYVYGVLLRTTYTSFTCGSDEVMRKQFQENRNFKGRHSEAESKILERSRIHREKKIYGVDDNIIPIVVHIVHNNGPENITEAQVLAGLQHLNEAFSNQGPFQNNEGTITGIQFCLIRKGD